MKKTMICLICLVALMAAAAVPSFAQNGQNSTINANATMNNTFNITANITNTANKNLTITNNFTKSGLRVGFENVKPVSNLDRYGTKAVYNIEKYSQNKLLFNGTNATPVQPVFNVSQRSGVRPTIVYTTGQTKPTYRVSASPGTPVYNVEGYSPIKMGSPIP